MLERQSEMLESQISLREVDHDGMIQPPVVLNYKPALFLFTSEIIRNRKTAKDRVISGFHTTWSENQVRVLGG